MPLKLSENQWSLGKYLPAWRGDTQRRKPPRVLFADFCGINIPTMSNFKLPG